VALESWNSQKVAEALALARQLEDDQLATFLTAQMGLIRVQSGDPAGEDTARRAIDHARASHYDALLPDIYLINGSLQNVLNHSGQAMAFLRPAYETAVATHDRRTTIQALALMASSLRAPEHATKEDLATAQSYLDDALELVDPQHERASLLDLLEGAALTDQRRGDLGGELQHLDAARRLVAAGVRNADLVWLESRTGAAYLELGRVKDALLEFERILPTVEKGTDNVTSSIALLGLAECYSIEGRDAEARQMLLRAGALVNKLGIPRLRAMYHHAAAEIAARRQDFRNAYDETKAMAEQQHLAAEASDRTQLQALKVQFEVARRDGENATLRARQVEERSKRNTLIMSLAMAGCALLSVAAFLWREIRQKRRFVHLALRDELTGAPNRRSMIDMLRMRVSTMQGGSSMIAILDIDHFKQVNDRWGHDVGDEALKRFYDACRGSLRASDALGRWGGEEFLLVGHGSTEDDVSALYDRVLAAVGTIQLPGAPDDFRLAFSMGVSHLGSGDRDVERAIKLADEALYRAKEGGRGRCEFSSS
jgi:diguanylate cyclase (GGDEF)-like protein